jgi:TonB family protein
VIAHEFGAPVQAAAAAAVNKTTVVHHAGFGPAFSRRTTVILLIVGLHVLMIYVLASAIVAPKVFKPSPPARIDVSFQPKPAPPVPPMPGDPTLERVRVHGPTLPPPVPSMEPADATGDQITVAAQTQPVGPPLPRPVNRVWGGPGAGFPNTDDFYPEAARRLGEKGITTVNVCVDGTGRLIGKPTVAQSSGSARLDEGALKLAKAGSGHYRATTEDGRPVNACYPFLVRFHLRD